MLVARILAYLFPAEERVNPFYFAGRAAVYGLLVFWGVKFIMTPMETNYVGGHFMHLINLPFHEAGHLVFMPFGRFMTVLGGSLGQLLMPLVCVGAFLFYNHDAFGGVAARWGVPGSIMD